MTAQSTPVVYLDLDRTAIYSAAALGLEIDDAAAPRLLCVELYRHLPQSFMTEAAAADLIELAKAATIVPTTTRTPAQLARVHLPGPPARYAIASNGGHLIVDGLPDPGWTTHVRGLLDTCAPLSEVESHLRRQAGPSGDSAFVHSIRTASDLFVYAVVDRATLPRTWAADLAAWCAPRGWVTSVQGRKVYALPRPLTKAAAAAEVIARTGGGALWAAGDSLLDAELLQYADAAVRPAHGELADVGFHAAHLAVTAATGVAAGQELLAWLLARARTNSPPRPTASAAPGSCGRLS
jgi:hypothetical protein